MNIKDFLVIDNYISDLFYKSYENEYNHLELLIEEAKKPARDKEYAHNIGVAPLILTALFRFNSELDNEIVLIYDHIYKMGGNVLDLINEIPALIENYKNKKAQNLKNKKNKFTIKNWKINLQINRISIASPFEKCQTNEDIACELGKMIAYKELSKKYLKDNLSLEKSLSDDNKAPKITEHVIENTQKPWYEIRSVQSIMAAITIIAALISSMSDGASFLDRFKINNEKKQNNKHAFITLNSEPITINENSYFKEIELKHSITIEWHGEYVSFGDSVIIKKLELIDSTLSYNTNYEIPSSFSIISHHYERKTQNINQKNNQLNLLLISHMSGEPTLIPHEITVIPKRIANLIIQINYNTEKGAEKAEAIIPILAKENNN